MIINVDKYIFMFFGGTFLSLLRNICSTSLPVKKIKYIVFLLLIFKIFIYFNINIWYYLCRANTISNSLVYFFMFLMTFFGTEKFIIVMNVQFVKISIIFMLLLKLYSRNICQSQSLENTIKMWLFYIIF